MFFYVLCQKFVDRVVSIILNLWFSSPFLVGKVSSTHKSARPKVSKLTTKKTNMNLPFSVKMAKIKHLK